MSANPSSMNAILLASATLAVAFSAAPAQAYQCKNSPHQAVGVRALKVSASMAARNNWVSSAKAQYGLQWSVWSIATAKQQDCVRLNTGKWRCLVSAKPCLYVVP
ncbi:MAG: hypothetical protein CTY31_13385 [Hyphomicrobium sp.]|nr:MAG: hypothetical protein CTY31_13385 [Hyphomicrobium sp.]